VGHVKIKGNKNKMKIEITFEEEDLKKLCIKATQAFIKNGTVVAGFGFGPYDRKVICEWESPDEPVYVQDKEDEVDIPF
jgi:hypothetical protein